MAFIIQHTDMLQLTVFTAYKNQVGINRFYYQATSSVGLTADAQAMADAIVPAIQIDYAAAMSSEAYFAGVKLQPAGDGPAYEPVYSSEVEDGAIAGDPLPGQITGLTTWRTELAGARHRGRTYWPFPAETDNIVTSVPSVGYQGQINALSTKMQTLTVTADATEWLLALHIWSEVDAVYREVTAYTVRPKWATQRRRGDFGRANILPF